MFIKKTTGKKAGAFFLVIFMLLTLFPVGAAASHVEGQEKTVVFSIGENSYQIGGNEVKTDVAPYIKDGRTMVPVAFVAPALGTEPAQWLPNERVVIIKKEGKELYIKIGSNELLINGVKMLMDASAEIKDVGNGGGRTMLPISFIAKALEIGYEWKADTSSVHFYGYNKSFGQAGSFGPDFGTEVIEGNIIIKADGVKLRNMTVKGNLIVSEEVGKGTVTLENIDVKGETFIRGGGKDSIHIIGGNYSNITIQNVDGQVRVTATGIDNLPVVIGEGAEGDEIILEGNFGNVTVEAPNSIISTQGQTVIGQIEVANQANGAVITLGSTTTVTKVVLEAETEVKGTGTIKEADIKADGIKFEKAPEQQTVAPNVTTQPTTTPPTGPTGGSGGGGGEDSDTTVNVSGITVAPTTMTLTAGGSAGTIIAAITPADASNKNVNWSSSDTNVATVANGVVTPIAAGTATITATAAADQTKTATCTVTVNAAPAGNFTPGEGGTLPAFTPFAEENGKIGGLYVSDNAKPLLFYFQGDPVIRNQVNMKFLPPSSFGASSYKLQYSGNNGLTWSNFQVDGTDVVTALDSQDNFSLENPGGDYQYRLLVVGGPKDGYTSNVVEAELAQVNTEFGWSLDEGMMLTGVIAPYIGRGLAASFTATKYIVDGQTVTTETYENQNMTYQWYRVNPVTYAMTEIQGATGLSYTTTAADAGYKLLIRATGDEINVGGYEQVFAQSDNVIPNKGFVSNATDSGFTLNLYKLADALAVGDLSLTDKNGGTVAIDSVTPGANNAIFNIAASINPSLSPYRLENNSDFWRIVSEVQGGHMMMQGVEITLADTTAPILSAASASRTNSTETTLDFTSDEAGTYYYLVYEAANSAPNAATVKAQGTAAAKGTAAASAAVNTVSVTGLAPSTAYKVYVVVEDAAGNISDVATIALTTAAAPDTVINIAAIAGVTAPVRAAVPVTTITETAQYTGSVAWSPADNAFGPSTVYTATITLTPKTGFTLTGVTENLFTVGGATSVTNAINSGVITAVFAATAAAPVEISEITNTMTNMRKGSIIMGYTFSGAAGVITYEQAISNTYALDLANSTVTLAKYDGTNYTQIGNTVNLSALSLGNSNVVGESANVTFADFGTLLTAFGLDFSNPANIPTHVKVVVRSKTSIDGKAVTNPWGPIDSGWVVVSSDLMSDSSIDAGNSSASIEAGNKTAGFVFPVTITIKDSSNANLPNGKYAVEILNGVTPIGGGAEIDFTNGQASVNAILANAGTYSLLVKVSNIEIETIANVTAVSSPVFVSAATTMDGTQIHLGFSKAMADPTGKQNQFTVKVNNVTNAVTAAALKTGDSTTIELTLTTALAGSETITIAYTQGDVAAADGGLLCTFIPADVSNNVPETTSITAVAISGEAKVGVELTAAPTPAAATASYKWMISDTENGVYADIGGATTNKYTPVVGDAGKYVKAEATGTGSYTGTITSAAKGPIAALSNNTSVTTKETHYNVTVHGSSMIPADNPITANTTPITTSVSVGTFTGNLTFPAGSAYKVANAASIPGSFNTWNFVLITGKDAEQTLAADDLLLVKAEDGTLRGYHITVTGTDETAPVLSATSASGTTYTATTLNFTSDEAGTYYYLVYAAAESAPNAATVKAQGAAAAKGTAAAAAAANTASVTGLAPQTAYKAYVVVEDAVNNISNVAAIEFTTLAAPGVDAGNSNSWFIGNNYDGTAQIGVNVFDAAHDALEYLPKENFAVLTTGTTDSIGTIDSVTYTHGGTYWLILRHADGTYNVDVKVASVLVEENLAVTISLEQ